MPKPYPREFRDDVVRVARGRDPKTPLEQIAKDFGIHQTTLNGWLRQADVEDGNKPGVTAQQSEELRELKRRNRLLEQGIRFISVPLSSSTSQAWMISTVGSSISMNIFTATTSTPRTT